MMGMADPWITVVFVLCLAAAGLCILWGITHWNRDEEDEPDSDIRHWAEEEDRVEQEL